GVTLPVKSMAIQALISNAEMTNVYVLVVKNLKNAVFKEMKNAQPGNGLPGWLSK
ncbi:MAG: hypothetical protein ACI9C4_000392, partial [Paraglaciecola sp.]